MNREAFEKWYVEHGIPNAKWLEVTFPLKEKEFRILMATQASGAWQAATAHQSERIEALREACAVLCETEYAINDGITCAEAIREMRVEV